MSKDAPLAVEVPASDRDKPGWVKVGVIAAVGFIIGIAWPRVMGIRLGPSAPGAAAAAASTSASRGGRAPDAPPASVVVPASVVTPASVVAPASAAPGAVPAPAAASTNVARASGAPHIKIQKGAVLSCKTKDGDKKGKECGPVPGLDQLVQPRVRNLATCSGAEGQSGKLSLVINADFVSGRFSYDIGKSSTITNVDAIASCLKTTFHGTSTASTPHEHPRYTVAYSAIFTPSTGAAAAPEGLAAKEDKAEKDKSESSAKTAPDEKKETKSALASGEAAVAWEVALVRDTPKTGGLLARLPRGTKVKVGTAKDGWFLIKYGESYAREGWVYRGAIGR